jgi:hypothetical protein
MRFNLFENPPITSSTGVIIIDGDVFIALKEFGGSHVGTYRTREAAIEGLRNCGIALAPIQGGDQ